MLEAELAALPGHGAKDGFAGGGHVGMIVADDEADAAQAAGDEAFEEVAPMHFGLAEGHADAQEGAFAVGADAQGDEDSTVAELAGVADFFAAGVEHQIGQVPSERSRHFCSSASRRLAQSLTWVELTSTPQSRSTTAETLRVETP